MKTTVVLYRQAAISMSKAPYRWVRAENARCWNKFHTCIHLDSIRHGILSNKNFCIQRKKMRKVGVFLDLNSK